LPLAVTLPLTFTVIPNTFALIKQFEPGVAATTLNVRSDNNITNLIIRPFFLFILKPFFSYLSSVLMARTKTESIKTMNTQNTTRRWETTIEQFP
jgi:hypothetical protein